MAISAIGDKSVQYGVLTMSTKIKSVVVSMVRGKNDLTGKIEYCKINVPESMIGCMVARADLEKSVGEKINIEIGHKTANLIYIDGNRDMIFGHETAKKYVNSDFTKDQIIEHYRRWQAVTTISGLLAKEGFDFPVERVTANMEKWNFTLADLETYATSVGKWNRVKAKLTAIGLIQK